MENNSPNQTNIATIVDLQPRKNNAEIFRTFKLIWNPDHYRKFESIHVAIPEQCNPIINNERYPTRRIVKKII